MPVPDYQTLMRPLLALHADGNEHSISVVRQHLAKEFDLSESEREERLPSGQARTFDNRVGWATTYLYRAGLLERPRRSVYRITARGRQTLADHPDRVGNDVLDQFDEFRSFRAPPVRGPSEPLPAEQADPETPEENIEGAYQQTRSALAADLLDRVIDQEPTFLERLVIELLRKMGYGGRSDLPGQVTGGTGDEGFDGVIREDQLGLDVIYIQAKRWQRGNNVGRPDIQAFVGALTGRGATKGIFITTSDFSADARDYVDRLGLSVVLISGQALAQYMIDYDIGVTTETRYELKKVDRDYFSEETLGTGTSE